MSKKICSAALVLALSALFVSSAYAPARSRLPADWCGLPFVRTVAHRGAAGSGLGLHRQLPPRRDRKERLWDLMGAWRKGNLGRRWSLR